MDSTAMLTRKQVRRPPTVLVDRDSPVSEGNIINQRKGRPLRAGLLDNNSLVIRDCEVDTRELLVQHTWRQLADMSLRG